MEFDWTPELEEYRRIVQAFAEEHRTPELLEEVFSLAEGQAPGPLMQAVRDDIERRGWVRMSWPKELGGEGRSPWYWVVLTEELARVGIPYGLGLAGMIAPAVERFGTPEQRLKYVPGLRSGQITIALGYSEPNAGTDLASLEIRAVRDGDDWIINGQKLWTSTAHVATHVWLAARTDPEAPKHRGISMFLVPLSTPGITVRPIWTMSGVRTNETFYEDVRVPHDALIGEENRGWYIAANALDHERVTMGGGLGLMLSFDQLVGGLKSATMLSDSARSRLAEVQVDMHVARALALVNSDIVARDETPTMEASMAKVFSSELRYRFSSVATELLGRAGALSEEAGDAAPMRGEMERLYRSSPIARFGGGTNEVQRNIIAQRGLRLPR